MESSIAIVNVRGPCSDITIPCVQIAFRPLHRSLFLDAPPPDNAALPDEIATPDNVKSPEKDVMPEDAASPESGDQRLEYPSRHEVSPYIPTNHASWLSPLGILDDLAHGKSLLL